MKRPQEVVVWSQVWSQEVVVWSQVWSQEVVVSRQPVNDHTRVRNQLSKALVN